MLRFITSDLRGNLLKIGVLAIGLAAGFLSAAMAWFDVSTDRFHPDVERLYAVGYDFPDRKLSELPGGFAPALQRFVPAVELATRTCPVAGLGRIVLDDGRRLDAGLMELADTNLFDIFPRRIIAGNADGALDTRRHCVIPESLARRIGGDVIGRKFAFADNLSRQYVIGAVYEDFPANSVMADNIYLAMPTVTELFGRDYTRSLEEGTIFRTVVKLAEGAAPASVMPDVERMLAHLLSAGYRLEFNIHLKFVPFAQIQSGKPDVRNGALILAILGALILGAAAFNYLLIAAGQTIWRAREIAIRKCFGTGSDRVFLQVLAEESATVGAALCVAAVIVAVIADSFGLHRLFSPGGIWLLAGGVVLAVLSVTALPVALILSRTPAGHAFRRHARGRSVVKPALLSVQIFAASFIFCLLSVAARQYHTLLNADMGMEYADVARAECVNTTAEQRAELLCALDSLECVASVATASFDYVNSWGGNNVFVDESAQENHVTVEDMNKANPAIFEVLGLEFTKGKPFRSVDLSGYNEVVIEEALADSLCALYGLPPGTDITGRRFTISGHTPYECLITGTIRGFNRGGFHAYRKTAHPAVILSTGGAMRHLYVRFRFRSLDAATLAEVQAVADRLLPGSGIRLRPYGEEVRALYDAQRRFARSVLLAGMVVLIIMLIGLIGYAADTVRRRAKEIAVRKVNGMNVRGILAMFCREVAVVAVPAVLFGAVAAAWAGSLWLERFTLCVPVLSVWLPLVCAAIIALLLGVVALACLRVVRARPVAYLRTE